MMKPVLAVQRLPNCDKPHLSGNSRACWVIPMSTTKCQHARDNTTVARKFAVRDHHPFQLREASPRTNVTNYLNSKGQPLDVTNRRDY